LRTPESTVAVRRIRPESKLYIDDLMAQDLAVSHWKGLVNAESTTTRRRKLHQIRVGKLQGKHGRDSARFRKVLRYVASHSQPLETQGIRPTLYELTTEYDTILKAREPHKGYLVSFGRGRIMDEEDVMARLSSALRRVTDMTGIFLNSISVNVA
jgi:hypothetical protein